MRFLTFLFLLTCPVCQGQSWLGIGASSGVSNFIPGRYQEPNRDYVLPAPVNFTAGKAFRMDSAIVYFYGRYEASVGNGFLLGPGVRLYSGKAFGMPTNFSPYIDFYVGSFLTAFGASAKERSYGGRTGMLAAVGGTYFVARNEGIDLQIGLQIGGDRFENQQRGNAVVSIGYHRFMPIKPKNKPRRQRARKPNDCPARYD